MRFCVIGAGSGGRAFAAYISSKGYPVSLYNRSFSRIHEIKKKKGIVAKGELEGFFPINRVTQDIEFAIKDADVIMVVTPAFAHKSIAEKMAPYLSKDQIILLNPGRTFGSVEFMKVIEKKRRFSHNIVGETQTLLFTSRELPGNKVNILKIKNSVNYSTYPEIFTYFPYNSIKNVFPQLSPVDNYLEITLNNTGMLLHPAISLFNAGFMDIGKEFLFYSEGATPRICEVLENIELEISYIFQKLGIKFLRYHKWAEKAYGIKANSIFDSIKKVKAYENIVAPNHLITRYFIEDVPNGLVPIASLGKYLHLETPLIDSIIKLSSILCGIDFYKEGRTIEKLQLHDFLWEKLKNKGISKTKETQKEEISIKISSLFT